MFAVSCSYDNLFQGALSDAYKAYQKWLTGVIALAICVSYMFVKIYEFPGPLPVQTLKSWIQFPTFPANFRIYRDTAIVVVISYFLLLDINSSYIWLCVFPLIAIGFIYSLFRELCRCSAAEHKDEDRVIKSGSPSTRAKVEEPSNDNVEIQKEPEDLEFIVMVPFCVLCALCTMAQLDSRATDRFVVSQFLLFLSSTLGVLTRMMIRLPAGASPVDVAPASELLQKSFLLLLLVTVHTVAAEALGEDVLLVCMPELVPVLLWFSIHLDRESPIISIDKIKPPKSVLIPLSAAAVASLAYLATSMDESGLSSCTRTMVACGVSGLLTYYVVFMLDQWPGQQPSANNSMAADTGLEEKSENQVGKDDNGATASSVAAPVQSEEQAGSSQEQEAMQLLMFWANALLIVAAALVLLKCVVARRLGLQEPLLDILCENFKLCRFSSEKMMDKLISLASIAQLYGTIGYVCSPVLLLCAQKYYVLGGHARLRRAVNISLSAARLKEFSVMLFRLFF